MVMRGLARWLPFMSRYAETAPACCNACRTCTTTNLLQLAAVVGAVVVAPMRRVLGSS